MEAYKKDFGKLPKMNIPKTNEMKITAISVFNPFLGVWHDLKDIGYIQVTERNSSLQDHPL